MIDNNEHSNSNSNSVQKPLHVVEWTFDSRKAKDALETFLDGPYGNESVAQVMATFALGMVLLNMAADDVLFDVIFFVFPRSPRS